MLDGESVSRTLEETTLIVAVKQNCDGCRDFVFSALDELRSVAVMVLSATADLRGEWNGAVQPIIVAPETLKELDIRWPPFYVLVDPQLGQVISEGVVFGPAQVAEEIAGYLAAP
jgi:hypothetical protein